MPISEPPARLRADTGVVAAGTALWRIHSGHRSALDLNPVIPSATSGGRFDSPDGGYAYSYFGASIEAAVAETFCRDVPTTRQRLLRAAVLTGKVLSEVRVREPITVALLHGRHLRAVGQDVWLTKSPSSDYPTTRRWAKAIIDGTTADGLAYRGRNDEDLYCYLLYSSQVGDLGSVLNLVQSWPLDQPDGGLIVRDAAALYRVAISHPDAETRTHREV